MVTLNECGGISDRSVLDPPPGDVGFFNVVSTANCQLSDDAIFEELKYNSPSVHPSPLAPQDPVWRKAMAPISGPLLV